MNNLDSKEFNNSFYDYYKKKCTIVISSCDKYKPALKPFFQLFKKYYSDCIFNIVVILEKESFSYDGFNIKVYNIDKNTKITDIPWSMRIRDALKSIETDYVFWLLEDMFIVDKMDQNKLFNWIDIMDCDPNIASISTFHFSPENTFFKNIDDGMYDGLEKRGLVSDFKLCAGGNLWRRNKLIYYLGDNESPWEWEAFANFRTFYNFKDKFYFLKKNEKKVYPFKYEGREWSPICRGKWYLPSCELFFKKENIEVDYDELGICSDEEMKTLGKGDINENMFIKWLRYSPFKPYISMLTHLKYFNRKHK